MKKKLFTQEALAGFCAECRAQCRWTESTIFISFLDTHTVYQHAVPPADSQVQKDRRETEPGTSRCALSCRVAISQPKQSEDPEKRHKFESWALRYLLDCRRLLSAPSMLWLRWKAWPRGHVQHAGLVTCSEPHAQLPRARGRQSLLVGCRREHGLSTGGRVSPTVRVVCVCVCVCVCVRYPPCSQINSAVPSDFTYKARAQGNDGRALCWPWGPVLLQGHRRVKSACREGVGGHPRHPICREVFDFFLLSFLSCLNV